MSWTTAALMAAGTTANYMAAKKSQAAMNDMQSLELERQKKHRKDSDALLGDSLKRSDADSAEGGIQDAEAKRSAEYANVLQPKTEGGAASDLANQLGVSANNKVISTEVGSRNSAANNTNAVLASAMAKLGGYGDNMLSTNIRNNRFLQEQQQIGNFMQGSANVLPFEMEAASHKGDGLKGVGDLLNAAAMVTGTMAATGYNPFSSAATPVYTAGSGMPLYRTAATAAAPSSMSAAGWGGLTSTGKLAASYGAANPTYMAPKIFKL